MIKKILPIFLTLVLVFLFTVKTYASGFNLKSIGALDTGGREISHWWYTGANPTMSGDAPASSTINVTIDGTSSTTTADANGTWSYATSGLEDGDHNITLENNGSKISFTLTLGKDNVDWDMVGKESSGSTLPASGNTLPTMTLIGFGGLMLILGRKFLSQA